MLIYNPAAGHRDTMRELQDAMRYLEERGWQIVWRKTHGHGDATTYAREAVATGLDVAIAAGGDGTIGQVVNGIAGTETALGVIPVGTANVWAREVGLPYSTPLHQDSVQEAVEMLAEGRSRRVDLGRVNGTYFLMWVGVGFDAQVTAEVDTRPDAKRRFGLLFFTITALATALNLKGTRATITLDGEKFNQRILMVVASNIQLYGGIMRIAPMASMNDGLLDISIFRGYTGLMAYIHFLSIMIGTHRRHPESSYHQGRHMTISTSRPLPVHLDGDVVGTTPVEIKVVPNALRVIVPAETHRTVLGRELSHLTHLTQLAQQRTSLAQTVIDFWRRIRQ